MRLEGRGAVVTGAASGIGAASAIALAREGVHVLVADINGEEGKKVVCRIEQAGGRACFFRADASRSEDVRKMVSAAMDAAGRLDILHNNAGIAVRHPVAEETEEDWDRCVRVNVKSVFLGSKYALPHMTKAGGSIINTSSVTGITGVRNRAAYSTTKGAIAALTRNMAVDYAPFGVRVNCVCPGFTRTPLIRRLLEDPERTKKLISLHPLGRLGTPEDIANAVVFLASDVSSWITGHALVVDGGFSAGQGADI